VSFVMDAGLTFFQHPVLAIKLLSAGSGAGGWREDGLANDGFVMDISVGKRNSRIIPSECVGTKGNE
jgi:hypothetical protein